MVRTLGDFSSWGLGVYPCDLPSSAFFRHIGQIFSLIFFQHFVSFVDRGAYLLDFSPSGKYFPDFESWRRYLNSVKQGRNRTQDRRVKLLKINFVRNFSPFQVFHNILGVHDYMENGCFMIR